LKAGLPPDSWLVEGTKVSVFEGEIFEEVKPSGEIRRKAIGES
jgi:AMMECR1 domain-containing protein